MNNEEIMNNEVYEEVVPEVTVTPVETVQHVFTISNGVCVLAGIVIGKFGIPVAKWVGRKVKKAVTKRKDKSKVIDVKYEESED